MILHSWEVWVGTSARLQSPDGRGVNTTVTSDSVCACEHCDLFSSYIPFRDRGLAMAKVMGRKHMLSKVATAAAEGVDPRDLSKLKTKAFITTFRVTED